MFYLWFMGGIFQHLNTKSLLKKDQREGGRVYRMTAIRCSTFSPFLFAEAMNELAIYIQDVVHLGMLFVEGEKKKKKRAKIVSYNFEVLWNLKFLYQVKCNA